MAISDGSPLAPFPPGGSARLWWNRRRRQAIAVLALGVAYGAVYGNGIWTSLAHVRDRNRVLVAPTRGAVPDIIYLQTAMAVVFAAFAAVAVVRVRPQVWVGQWPWAQDRRPSTPTVLGAVGAVLSCYALADLVLIPLLQRWDAMNGYATDYSPVAAWATAVQAGVGEEVIVLAVAVTVLRYLRVRPWVALPVLVAMRLAYHLYYGVLGVWWLAPWAVVSAVVYWRWRDPRLLVALIVAHVISDMRGPLFGDRSGWVFGAAALVLLLGATAADRRWWLAPASYSTSLPVS